MVPVAEPIEHGDAEREFYIPTIQSIANPSSRHLLLGIHWWTAPHEDSPCIEMVELFDLQQPNLLNIISFFAAVTALPLERISD
jgi:hypothetical protein